VGANIFISAPWVIVRQTDRRKPVAVARRTERDGFSDKSPARGCAARKAFLARLPAEARAASCGNADSKRQTADAASRMAEREEADLVIFADQFTLGVSSKCLKA
jgi:hypothetical protein